MIAIQLGLVAALAWGLRDLCMRFAAQASGNLPGPIIGGCPVLPVAIAAAKCQQVPPCSGGRFWRSRLWALLRERMPRPQWPSVAPAFGGIALQGD